MGNPEPSIDDIDEGAETGRSQSKPIMGMIKVQSTERGNSHKRETVGSAFESHRGQTIELDVLSVTCQAKHHRH